MTKHFKLGCRVRGKVGMHKAKAEAKAKKLKTAKAAKAAKGKKPAPAAGKGISRAPPLKRSDPAFSTLRPSLAPGSIAIVLAGRYRGRRVVVLSQLPHNGPVVVTGPFRLNGVPLRRVDPRYLIGTQTRVPLDGVNRSCLTPSLFRRAAAAPARAKGENDFMGKRQKQAAEKGAIRTGKAATGKAKGEAKSKSKAKSAKPDASNSGKKKKKGQVSSQRYRAQKSIDAAVLAAVKKDPLGKAKLGYLRSVFTLKPGDTPHRMKF